MRFKTAVFKKDSTRPILEVVVGADDYDGFPSDPDGATVTFTMILLSDLDTVEAGGSVTPKVDDVAAAVTAGVLLDDGTYKATLTYEWAAEDRDTIEDYLGEFKIDEGAGVVTHIPTGELDDDDNEIRKYIPIKIVASLN